MGSSRLTRVVLGALILGVLPLFLRLWPVGHGAPRPEYVPDTHVVRNALQMAANKDPVPPAGKYSSYPYLLPYMLLPVYAADYAAGRVSGEWSGGGEYGMHLKENPWRAHRLARILLAILSATAPLFIFGAARASGMGAGAWLAAFLAGTSLLHVHLSVQERPWAPMAAAVAATAWAAAVHARSGTRRSLLVAALAAAVTFSIHQGGVVVLGMVGVAWAVAPTTEGSGGSKGALKTRLARGVGAVALFAGASLAMGHAYLVRYGPTEKDQVAAQELVRDDMIQITIGSQQVVLGLRWETFTGLSRAFLGYDPVILIAGLLGLVLAFRRRTLLPSMVFLVGWAAFFMTNVNEHIRYLLPMAMLMTLPAGLFLETLWRRPVGRFAVLGVLIVPLTLALRLGHVLNQEDTRSLAADRLMELPEGSRVAIDVYGPVVPQTLPALEMTERLRTRVDSALYGREAHRRDMLAAGQPQAPGVDAVRLEDAFEYDLRTGGTWIRDLPEDTEQAKGNATDDPTDDSARDPLPHLHLGGSTRSALAAIGATHILLVDRTPDDGVEPPLVDPTPSRPYEGAPAGTPADRKLAPLVLTGDPEWTLHPGWGDLDRAGSDHDHVVPSAHFPTEAPFPLRDLWRVHRPGPKLVLYRL